MTDDTDNIPPEAQEEQSLEIARRKGREGGDVRADDQAQAAQELKEQTRPPAGSDSGNGPRNP